MSPSALLLAIDPGPKETAYVLLDPLGTIEGRGKIGNELVLELVRAHPGPVVIEMIACYGMAVGAEVFETCLWIGRYIQAARTMPHRVYRLDVKLHLCRSPRATDSNVLAALLDRYGGKDVAKGRKHAPGPCYGMAQDMWAALAVGVTFQDRPGAFGTFA